MRDWGGKKPIAVVDIDGVLATGTVEDVYSEDAGWAFGKCSPIFEGIEILNRLREQDVKIVLHTARWEDDRAVTEHWLSSHEVAYDELIMGKPSADIYIDDKNFPVPFIPEDWDLDRAINYILDEIESNRGKRT